MPVDLHILTAEREISRQLIRFGRAMDEREWSVLREILIEDATAELGTGVLTGHDEIISLIRSFLDGCGTTQHFVGSILIDVDGDTATSCAYVRDMHIGVGDRSHLEFSTLGDYRDRWVRRGGSWRLRHRTKLNRAQIGALAVFGIEDQPR